jgi:hypothetical protein
MMKNRLYASFEILACFFVFLVAFGSTADCGPNAVPVEPNRPVEAAPKTDIAVTVNGVAITESQVDAQVARELWRRKIPQQMPPEFVEQYKKEVRQQVLEDLIARVFVD